MTLKSVITLPATLVAAVAGFVLLLSAGAPSPRAAANLQISQELRARSQRAGRVRVIVELTLPSGHVPEASLSTTAAVFAQRQAIGARAARLLSRLPARSHRTIHQYQTVPYLAIEVTPAALDALELLDTDIVRVMDDAILTPVLAESVPLIEGDQVWASGFDGSGTTIAVVDSGVDSTHPFLAGKVVEEACFSSTVAGTSQTVCPNGLDEQFGPGAAAPCSLGDCFHGTHVAGIAAGNDPTNSQQPSGVAKGAQVMAVQVFSRIVDPTSCGGVAPCLGAFTSDIIAGLERVYSVAVAGQQNIAAVNLSLGGDLFEAPCDDQPYKPIIDNLRAIGVASVVAAGNSGWPFGLSTPACISSAVSVGSTTKTDGVSWFTNASSFLSLFAPGESITSSVPGGSYEAQSGTSMAAPHVAGAWGLIKQAVPGASVTTVLNALQTTGLPITDMRYWFFGPGATVPRVRVFEALSTLVPIDGPIPIVTSLSPVGTHAGLGAITLTVSGSGFIGRSVVEWNGAARPTTFISSSKLEASIPATDVAAAGTAQVRVVTPAPGGGTSSALTFTIDPPPTLAVSAPVVAPGDPVTVTLEGGFGGSADWIALAATAAPDTSYLQWTYVGTGVTDRTWTVTMPTTAGTYEFRLFVNNVKVVTSPSVTIDPSVNPAPVVSSLSPATAVAGGSSFTLTVTGSKFMASSVVRWNGDNRPTTFLSATQLQAAISAGDIAATGSAQLTVFTPAPGGGTSSPVTMAIASPPSLSVSATNVAAGGAVTATLTGGFGGGGDWMTLAATGSPNTSYVQWVYVGGGVTTRTWTVTMPATPGTYEFRLLLNNGYTLAATSPSVTVGGGGGGTTPTLTVNTTNVVPGGAVTATLTGGSGGGGDWMTLAATGSPNTSYVQWIYVGAGVTTRTWTVSMPATAGTYEFRLFLNNGYTRAATSPPVTVEGGGGGTSPTLTVNTTSIVPGGAVTVTLANGLGGGSDWMVLAATGTPDTSYVQWTYVGAGVTTRTWTVTMPATSGTYEFRLFLNNSYTRAATSVPITVGAGGGGTTPTLTVSTTSIAPGGAVTVTLAGGLGGGSDWMALAATGSPNTSSVQWTYVGAGVTTRTWTVTMPTTTGSYEFRLFLNNGYTRAATSPTVSVVP